MASQAEVQAALDELATALVGSKFRTKLREKTEEAEEDLEAAANLPSGLLKTLGTMSDEELKTVAIVQQQLNVDANKSAVSILF